METFSNKSVQQDSTSMLIARKDIPDMLGIKRCYLHLLPTTFPDYPENQRVGNAHYCDKAALQQFVNKHGQSVIKEKLLEAHNDYYRERKRTFELYGENIDPLITKFITGKLHKIRAKIAVDFNEMEEALT